MKSIEQQNEAFLTAAIEGKPMPENYAWLAAPNVPHLPEPPEVVHRRELEARIAARTETLLGWARGNKNIGREPSTSDVEEKIADLKTQMATAIRYGNDLTRLETFIELAAQVRYLNGLPGVRPTTTVNLNRKGARADA